MDMAGEASTSVAFEEDIEDEEEEEMILVSFIFLHDV
jgi:hypothetical protein